MNGPTTIGFVIAGLIALGFNYILSVHRDDIDALTDRFEEKMCEFEKRIEEMEWK